MKYSFLIKALLPMLVFLISCSQGREIVLPEDLELIAQKSSIAEEYKDYSEFNKAFVAYIGKQDPKTQLYRIELALQDAVDKGLGYMIYVSGTSPKELKEILVDLDYGFAVYADVDSQFKDANDIDEDIRYTGLIINSKGDYLSSPMIHWRD